MSSSLFLTRALFSSSSHIISSSARQHKQSEIPLPLSVPRGPHSQDDDDDRATEQEKAIAIPFPLWLRSGRRLSFHKVHLRFVKRPEGGRRGKLFLPCADVTGTLYGAVNLGALLAEQPSTHFQTAKKKKRKNVVVALREGENLLFRPTQPTASTASPHKVTFKKASFHKSGGGGPGKEQQVGGGILET